MTDPSQHQPQEQAPQENLPQAHAGSTSTAGPATSPPPLPFDPRQVGPAPTLGSMERQGQQNGQNGQAFQNGQAVQPKPERKAGGWSTWGNGRRAAAVVGSGLLGLLLLRIVGGGGGTTVINSVPTGTAVPTTSTTAVAQVPMRAVPTGAKIGGFPVRDSALMIINGEVDTASVAALTYLGENPGVGVCNLYVGSQLAEASGYFFSGARTEDAEVKLVDCEVGADGPTATVPPVQESTTTAPAPAGQ